MIRRGSRAGDRPGDQGAVAAVVAVLLAGGVLMGMGAIVIDVGRLYAEREQLQTGADAASWRIAEACIATPATCTNAGQVGTAQAYAERNALDGAANAQVCLGGTVCPAWNTAVSCPPQAPSAGSYVEVRTTTRNPNGTTLLPPSLAGAVSDAARAGTRVGACARVTWGAPAAMRVFALGISLCDWDRISGDGQGYLGIPLVSPVLDQVGVSPVLGLPTATAGADGAVAASIPLGLSATVCTTPLDLLNPRGYAWLGNPDSSCKISVGAPATVPSFLPLGTTAANCAQALRTLRDNRQAVVVPIYDRVVGLTTLLGTYRVVGYAAFVVTGYTALLGGLLGTVSNLSNGLPALAHTLCGLAACIYGYFTRMVVPSARPVFSPVNDDYGVTVIGRTG